MNFKDFTDAMENFLSENLLFVFEIMKILLLQFEKFLNNLLEGFF
jgi:hypothetical protein